MRRRLIFLAVAFPLLVVACGSTKRSPTGSTVSGSPTASGPNTAAGSTSSPGANGALPVVARATNRKVEPVISPGSSPPPTTLLTKDLVVGTGETATTASTIKVNYVIADYADGRTFDDTTWITKKPTTFSLVGVPPGLSQGVAGMRIGGRREIVVPPSLGYGTAGRAPAVAPNETLVFVVDLVGLP